MDKYSILGDYSNLTENNIIAIVPVKCFNISKKYEIGNIRIYPKGTLDENEIRGYKFDFNFEEIKSKFYDATIITIPIEYERKNIMGVLFPSEKRELIKRVIEMAEDVMNVFRYLSSNFDKVSNLPQRAGYIDGIISGFLLFYIDQQMSDYVWGKYYITNTSIGEGLDLSDFEMSLEYKKYFLPIINVDKETGSIIKHAFRIYSDILYMPTATNKFMQSMSLIEYLANPFKYEQMQKAKTKILPFSSDCKKKYFELCDRFKYLTSQKDTQGKEIGLRTSIVHNGKNLEQLINKGYEIDLLLRELQMYICNFINETLPFSNKEWDYVKTKIEEKMQHVQTIKSGYDGKLEADVAIIIDFSFLNQALKEVYQWYPQYIDRKFDIVKFLLLLLQQSDIDRNGYQIPVQIFYEKDEKIYNCNQDLLISQYEEKGFDSQLGEISIYTFDAKEKYQFLMQTFLRGYLREQNYYVDRSTKFTNLVFVSDRNEISDEIFKQAEISCKKIILGRLDNKRTSCYDVCTWFDIEYLIMQSLEIELYEECVDNFIFKVEDARYK